MKAYFDLDESILQQQNSPITTLLLYRRILRLKFPNPSKTLASPPATASP
jgi:hypothetical protein